MMRESTKIQLKRLTGLTILALTFTVLGILFASRMQWTESSVAGDDEISPQALEASGILTPEGVSPFVAVAQKVMPAVVNITAKKEDTRRQRSREFFDWGPFRDLFPESHPDIPRGVTSGGSGIIIDRDGYILTNNHVVSDATDIEVKDANGHEYRAEIIGTDPESDVALIRVTNTKFSADQVADLGDSETIKVGDWAIAIGNPFGLDQTVTVGVISAKGRSNLFISGGGPSYQNFIQTDASINFGNSGGPLTNIHGQVIGVNTAINTQGQGIGFAIPINLAKSITEQLRTDGQVTRGYLGMLPRELDDATREALKLDREVKGVFVDSVEDDTPAEKGGLEAGDVITHVDGKPVVDASTFRFMIAEKRPGTQVKLTVLRNGDEKRLRFTLGNRADYNLVAGSPQVEEDVWLGLHIEGLNSPQALQWDIEAEDGVLVVEVDFDSPAEGKIQPQDVIIEINRKAVENMESYRKIIAELGDNKDAVLFRVIRNGRKTYEAVKP
jgi:Do/DeqQ family serine protease